MAAARGWGGADSNTDVGFLSTVQYRNVLKLEKDSMTAMQTYQVPPR